MLPTDGGKHARHHVGARIDSGSRIIAIRDFLARPLRFHLHFTPSGSSWIKQVERWFGLLTDQLIRGGVCGACCGPIIAVAHRAAFATHAEQTCSPPSADNDINLEEGMAVTTGSMTDEQRKSVALESLKAFDSAGTTSTGGSILDLFADDAEVFFPKWGIANGKESIGKLFSDVGSTLKEIKHDYATINWIFSGSDMVVAEGTSRGEHRDGPWRPDEPDWGAGRWCDVFEVRDFLIQRVYVYFDPDYAGRDTDRYPWLAER